MKITKDNTLIILDWDDTLFPTSWILENGLNVYDKNNFHRFKLYFKKLDKILFKLLTKLSFFGSVIIVTNALPEWISVSSKFLLSSYPIIKNTKIISARKIYQNKVNASDWKKHAFHDELTNITKNKNIINIISVGDAEYEYQALINLHHSHDKNKLLKSVKLIKNPSHDALIDQLDVLHNAIPHICLKPYHADLLFENNQ